MLMPAETKGLLLSSFVLAAMTSFAHAEPVRLDAPAMDVVTAGAAVDVATAALALGGIALTSATTQTHVVKREGVSLGVGVGLATALGCCGSESQAAAAISTLGDGDLVFGHSLNTHVAHPKLSQAISMGIIIAIDLP